MSIQKQHCGPGGVTIPTNSVVNAICKQHDDGYGQIIQGDGTVEAYIKFNWADKVMLEKMMAVPANKRDLGWQSVYNYIVAKAAVAPRSLKRKRLSADAPFFESTTPKRTLEDFNAPDFQPNVIEENYEEKSEYPAQKYQQQNTILKSMLGTITSKKSYRKRRSLSKGQKLAKFINKVINKREQKDKNAHLQFSKMDDGQISWSDGTRGEYISSFLDYDGDILSILSNMSQVPIILEAGGIGAVDPGFDALATWRARLKILSGWKQWTFRNNDNMDADLSIYMLAPKMDSYSDETIVSVWKSDLENNIATSSAAPNGITAANMLTNLNTHILMSREINRKYKCFKKQRIRLQPGEEVKVRMRCGYKNFDLVELFNRSAENGVNTLNHVEGLTQILYASARGTLVHEGSTVGYSGGIIDVTYSWQADVAVDLDEGLGQRRMYDSTGESLTNPVQANEAVDIETDA